MGSERALRQPVEARIEGLSAQNSGAIRRLKKRAEWLKATSCGVELGAWSGKVGTGFPNRPCSKRRKGLALPKGGTSPWVAKAETGPGPPVELADLRPKVVFNLGAEGSLTETSGNRRKCGPGKKTGH
jgi:hypothetical protein